LANALTDLARVEYPRKDGGLLREAFVHYEKALRRTQTPDIVHCNYAKAVHDLARITGDLRLYKKSSTHFNIAAKFNPNYYSVFLSWGHALRRWASWGYTFSQIWRPDSPKRQRGDAFAGKARVRADKALKIGFRAAWRAKSGQFFTRALPAKPSPQ